MEISELDRLVDLRAMKARQAGEPERPEEASWKASVRAYNAAQEAARRAEWAAYHAAQAERLRRTMEPLIASHEALAARLQAPTKG